MEQVGFEVGVEKMQSSIYRIDKQQGPTVYHRELYSVLYWPKWEKNLKKSGYMYMYVCVSRSVMSNSLQPHGL